LIHVSDISSLLQGWLSHYGTLALFILLALGIVGLPIPDETLLVLAGFMAAHGHLSVPVTIAASFCGSIFGITLSYLIGWTAGRRLLRKYGSWIGVTAERLERTHQWFEWIGKWLLLVGYFIPGVRHLVGVVAGMAELEYWKFAALAYTGAIIWCSVFLSIGYFFHDSWQYLHQYL
jgi:membrane protein DedA with SNARE-associated domain